MPPRIDWFRAVFSKSGDAFSGGVPEAVPEYIPSIPAPMNTPVSPIRIGGNSYSLSGPTQLITRALRANKTVSYLSMRKTLGDISMNISRNPSLIASSAEEVSLFGDRLYHLQRGFSTLYARAGLPNFSALSEENIDRLLHFERNAKWLNGQLQTVEPWEFHVYPKNLKTPYLIRRKYLEGLLLQGEETLLQLGVRRRRLPLPVLAMNLPKKDFFLPVQRLFGQTGLFFRNFGEVVKEEFALGWKDIRENPVTIGMSIVTTILLVGAVTYWASERNTTRSFYDDG